MMDLRGVRMDLSSPDDAGVSTIQLQRGSPDKKRPKERIMFFGSKTKTGMVTMTLKAGGKNSRAQWAKMLEAAGQGQPDSVASDVPVVRKASLPLADAVVTEEEEASSHRPARKISTKIFKEEESVAENRAGDVARAGSDGDAVGSDAEEVDALASQIIQDISKQSRRFPSERELAFAGSVVMEVRTYIGNVERRLLETATKALAASMLPERGELYLELLGVLLKG
jgi:hypothetical protein